MDDATSGKAVESTLTVKWEQEHFLKAEAGKTYIPFTLAVDPPALAPNTLFLRTQTKLYRIGK